MPNKNLPPFLDIPRDEDDYRYSQSFSVEGHIQTTRTRILGYLWVPDCQGCSFPKRNARNWETIWIVSWENHAKGLSTFGMPKGVDSLFCPSLLHLRQKPIRVPSLERDNEGWEHTSQSRSMAPSSPRGRSITTSYAEKSSFGLESVGPLFE